jgi:acetyl esterase
MSAHWENIGFDGVAKPPVPMRLYDGTSGEHGQAGRKGKAPPLVLYLRGGAFLNEGREPAECPVGKALAETGAVVLEADYSAVSHNMFPKAMECAFAALNCLSSKRKQFGAAKSPLLVVGSEAGGNVAAGVALKARDQMPGELTGQVLLSPMIDPLMANQSFRRAGEIGMREKWSDGWSHYLQNACGFQHPYAAPCLCSRLSGVAPALLVTSEDDPLHDEALGYADRLEASDVSVRRRVFSSGCGWTSIYGDGEGQWMAELCAEFTGFVRDLRQ